MNKPPKGWYVGQIEEIPAVLSEERTIDELKSNLVDALQMIFETDREMVREDLEGKTIIEEAIVLDE